MSRPQFEEPYLSHSRIRTYLQCPLRYRFRYRERRPPAFVSAALILGGAVHEAVAWYCARLHHETETSPEDFTEYFREEWRARVAEEDVAWFGKDPDELEDLGATLCAVFAADYEPAATLALEEPFRVPLVAPHGNREPWPLVGVFDRIERDEDGRLTVVEVKTAGRRWSEGRVDSDLQLSLYAYAASRNGLAENADVLVSAEVLTKTKNPELVRYYTVRDSPEHQRTIEHVHQVAESIRKEAFYPNPGWYCRRCEYRPICAYSQP